MSVIYKALSSIEAEDGRSARSPAGLSHAEGGRRAGVAPWLLGIAAAVSLSAVVVMASSRFLTEPDAALATSPPPPLAAPDANDPPETRTADTSDPTPPATTGGSPAADVGAATAAAQSFAEDEPLLRFKPATAADPEPHAGPAATAADAQVARVAHGDTSSSPGSASSLSSGWRTLRETTRDTPRASGAARTDRDGVALATASGEAEDTPATTSPAAAPADDAITAASTGSQDVDIAAVAPPRDRTDNPDIDRPVRIEPNPAAVVETVSRRTTSGTIRVESNSPGHTRVAVTRTNDAQRMRLLNVRLNEAIARRDQDAIADTLISMQHIAGPNSSYMLKMRAFTQLSLDGDADYAMQLLREVLARDPRDTDAALNLAVAEIKIGDTDSARTRLNELALLLPEDARVDSLLRSLR